MKIAAGVCFYNDCKSLERTLQSLVDKVDYMVCVDGRYKGFKDSGDGLSNDGSRELVRSFNKSVLINMPNVYEVEKRQGYLDWCDRARPDWLLIIDSDEYVSEYDKTVLESKLAQMSMGQYAQYNVFAVMLEVYSGKYDHIVWSFVSGQPPQTTREGERRYEHSPRLWARPWEMEYYLRHYHFRKKDPTSSLHYQEQNPAVAIVSGMKLNHDHALRTREHLEKRREYQRQLVELEQKKIPAFHKRTGLNPLLSEFDEININDSYIPKQRG